MSDQNTIAITGTTGHLASAVIPLLIGKGYRVRALVYRQEPSFDSLPVEYVRGSVFDESSLSNLVKDCSVVIHCAAMISLNSNADPAVYETNVKGTQNVFHAAKKAGARRFIHLSSIHAFHQMTDGSVLNEESPFCLKNAPRYDQSKRDAQQFVLQSANGGMEVVVLNPTAVIGPFDSKPSFLGKAVMDIYNRKVPLLIRGGFDFCDVRDVAAGIVSAIDRGRNGQSYLLGGKWHDLSDLQGMILGIKGDTRPIPVLPAWTGYAGLPFILLAAGIRRREPLYTKESIMALTLGNKKISSGKAEAELGYRSRPLQETITDSIAWFKQAGYLNTN